MSDFKGSLVPNISTESFKTPEINWEAINASRNQPFIKFEVPGSDSNLTYIINKSSIDSIVYDNDADEQLLDVVVNGKTIAFRGGVAEKVFEILGDL
ncbi:hypothetical protein H9Q13_13285 [Pontibacter sp. JH31]|uniref:Uncharacterized protein n=1 Tax=Pontibacter aquaedesilientis TaxID=2766980 RepID=A0ABR7XIP5_9BACT|nr:hypothetical protein [Pontibacter aquaedesilientis]MBD1398142.1 hypothetical protein [Pontibacter aquaedesilientis]